MQQWGSWEPCLVEVGRGVLGPSFLWVKIFSEVCNLFFSWVGVYGCKFGGLGKTFIVVYGGYKGRVTSNVSFYARYNTGLGSTSVFDNRGGVVLILVALFTNSFNVRGFVLNRAGGNVIGVITTIVYNIMDVILTCVSLVGVTGNACVISARTFF